VRNSKRRIEGAWTFPRAGREKSVHDILEEETLMQLRTVHNSVIGHTRKARSQTSSQLLPVRRKKQSENILRISSMQKTRLSKAPIMVYLCTEECLESWKMVYRTMTTTPAASARPPNPAPTTAAPPVEAAGLVVALLEAEEAELAADLVAVLIELAALDAALVAELCLLEAIEDMEAYGISQTGRNVYRTETKMAYGSRGHGGRTSRCDRRSN
jgi:hypothetical protein